MSYLPAPAPAEALTANRSAPFDPSGFTVRGSGKDHIVTLIYLTL